MNRIQPPADKPAEKPTATSRALDTALDRLPYGDGSGRRRFVVGGITLMGLVYVYWFNEGKMPSASPEAVLSSPLLAVGAVLIVYAIGSLFDVIGELFLVRAASAVFWMAGVPRRLVTARRSGRSLRSLSLAMGYEVMLDKSTLSVKAFEYWSDEKNIPMAVRKGLRFPVGNHAELAFQYVVHQFSTDGNRRWARRLLSGARDVSSTTTAALTVAFVLLFGPLSFVIDPYDPEKEKVSIAEKDLRDRIEQFQLPDDIAPKLKAALQANFDSFVRAPTSAGGPFWEALTEAEGEAQQARAELESTPNEVRANELGPLENHIDLVTKLALKLGEAHQELPTWYDSFRRSAPRVGGMLLLFLFLYVGFFAYLRNTVVTILEALALEPRKKPAGGPSGPPLAESLTE